MTRHVWRLAAMIRRWAGRGAPDRTLDAELESFLQHEIDARAGSGMTSEQARRTALAAIGGIQQVKEQARDARTGARLDVFARDVRYAVRTVRRAPGLSIAVVGSLAVGIAVTSAGYAFINAWLFRDLPGVTDQQRLVALELRRGTRPGGVGNVMSSRADHLALQSGLAASSDVAAITERRVALQLPEPHSALGLLVSTNYFEVVGTRMSVGRTFHPDEGQSSHATVAVISHGLWQRAMNSDPAVIGRPIRVGDTIVQVVGVTVPGFAGTSGRLGGERPDIWLPLALAGSIAKDAAAFLRQDRLSFIARLKPGVEMAQVQPAADVLASARAVAAGSPHGWAVVSSVSLLDPTFRVQAAVLVMSIPMLVLVVACANAANLTLARGSRQRREVAIRLAIGAARGRVVRQLLLENLLLALAAAAVGLPLARLGLTIAAARFALPMPIDVTVVGWTLLTAALSAVLSGLVPAFRVTARAPLQALSVSRGHTEATPSESRGKRAMVAAQAALAIGVLVVGTQVITLIEGDGATGGTSADRLLMASFDLDQVEFDPEEASAFYQRLLEAASRLAGAEAVGLARPTAVWTFGRGKAPGSVIAWAPGRQPEVVIGGYAGGDLFGAIGLRLLRGRTFTDVDRVGPPRVAVVNAAYEKALPDGQAIGRTIHLASYRRQSDAEAENESREVTIVGVVESAGERRYSRDGSPVGKIYVPSPLSPEPALTLYVRSRTNVDALLRPIRQAAAAIDPRVPVSELGSLASVNERSMGAQHWLGRASVLLGFIALLLAAAGLFAMVSYSVSERARDLAVRLALGAAPPRLLLFVLARSMTTASLGLIAGSLLGLAVSRVIAAEFHGAPAVDLGALGQSASIFLTAMLLASAIPAVRAARIDPVANLKDG